MAAKFFWTNFRMLRAKDNPYATERVLRQRYRFDAMQWHRFEAQVRRFNNRGAIVGPHGSGKTTLLEDFAERLSAQGQRVHLVRLSSEFRELPSAFDRPWAENLGPRDWVLVDGAEQLDGIDWWKFRRRVRLASGLILTTHRPGRLPTLHRCLTSPALLRDLVVALGEELSDSEAEQLFQRFRGNLREALRELYDRASADFALPEKLRINSA